MDTAIMIWAILASLMSTLTFIVLVRTIKLKSSAKNDDKLIEKINEEGVRTREVVATANKSATEALFIGVNQTNEQVLARVKELIESDEKRFDALQKELTETLKQVREDNEKKLDSIRATVDEKLTKTLDERIAQSFKSVSERLEAVNKSIGEMQTLNVGINDLKKTLTGVKTRGTWGEVSLDSLLTDILTPEQYERNSKCGGRAQEYVDFAVILPGSKSDKVYLPMDCKCPIEDYYRLIEAYDVDNKEECELYRKALQRSVKKQATSIKDKYIKPPKTTDFAIMYLPIESLYAEVLREPGFVEKIQNEQKVIIAGPANIAALLNSLRMGFKSVQIQKNSSEILKALTGFSKDFGNFIELIENANTQVDRVKTTLSKASDKTAVIRKKLDKVEGLAPTIEDSGSDSIPVVIE